MLIKTSKAESVYYDLVIDVSDTGDGVYNQGEEIYFDGDVYNQGDDYPGTFDCTMWIETLGGTFVTYILDEDYEDLGEGQTQDLDPSSWTPTQGGYYYVCGQVTYNGIQDDTDSHLFRVRYFENS